MWLYVPTSRSVRGSAKGTAVAGGARLPGQTEVWATPNAHDGRRLGVDEHSTQGGNLNRDAASWTSDLSHQAQESENAGPKSCAITRTSLPPSQRKRLNATFVEWLMGMPIGWTTAWNVSEQEVTRWFRQQRLLLCSLLRKG